MNVALKNPLSRAWRAWTVGLWLGMGLLAPAVAASAPRDPELLRALSAANPVAVRWLVAAGADANGRDARGTPILVAAASLRETSERVEAFRVALDEGAADPDLRDSAYVGDDRTALHMAASTGSIRLVRLLLSRGASPDLPNRFGETPLYLAAERGHLEVAALLLESGADANRRTRHTRMTPLAAAAEGGHAALVRVLLRFGADPVARDSFGRTPLKAALRRIDAGSDVRYIRTVQELKRWQRPLITEG